ncbi:MAG: serpin family protein, partial [Ruoffia tabacinasalis]
MFNLLKRVSQLCKYLLVVILAVSTMTPGLVSASEQVEGDFEGNLAQQIQDFSQELRPLVSEEVEENALYSPLSYYLALLTLEPGLTGSEKERLSEVLIPEGMDRDEYVASMASFIKEATEGDEPIFDTKTYLLGREDLKWNSTYLEDTKDLATEASRVDFQDSSTYESLNEDIAELTEGLIDPYYSEARIAEMTSND